MLMILITVLHVFSQFTKSFDFIKEPFVFVFLFRTFGNCDFRAASSKYGCPACRRLVFALRGGGITIPADTVSRQVCRTAQQLENVTRSCQWIQLCHGCFVRRSSSVSVGHSSCQGKGMKETWNFKCCHVGFSLHWNAFCV